MRHRFSALAWHWRWWRRRAILRRLVEVSGPVPKPLTIGEVKIMARAHETARETDLQGTELGRLSRLANGGQGGQP